MPRVFVSHSSSEQELATNLAHWIDGLTALDTCFCSSRPEDLLGGTRWRGEIHEQAQHADVCLMLLSPDSVGNPWLHFEAGLILGADFANKTVPVLYGGLRTADIPGTVSDIQALDINDPRQFNATMSGRLNLTTNQDYHASFMEQLSLEAARLIKYGRFGLMAPHPILPEPVPPFSLVGGQGEVEQKRLYPKDNELGTVFAIRATLVPRRSDRERWKFGIRLEDPSKETLQEQRVFEFHAGRQEGLSTWTVYFSPHHDAHVNVPCHLEVENEINMELWLSSDGSTITCVGVDTDGRRVCIENDLGRDKTTWRLENRNWTEVGVKAWGDGNAFVVDVQKLEFDRHPVRP